ncbi:nuclear transport factor 2 family protein [Halorubrum sp. DTA98]|uniref:nuclear transport factor 2 family protein n=1 Tax=Halorubrum sp. DTA98 TaxID=3402163 RepID=UPI003AAE2DBD
MEGPVDRDGTDCRTDRVRAERTVRAYYEAIDADEYDRLIDLLDPAFVHDRPDLTLDGRDRFVAFMRDERPMTDTDHVVDRVYTNGTGVAVRGRLLDADGAELFGYVDVFALGGDGRAITRLETYVSTE